MQADDDEALQRLPAEQVTAWGEHVSQSTQRLSLLMLAARNVNDEFQEHIADLTATFNEASYPAELGLEGHNMWLPLRNAALHNKDIR